MSFCPHHLLRFRLRAGLPSCAPQRRFQLEHWSRQRTRATAASYYSDHAPQSNITTYDEALDGLKIPSDHHGVVPEEAATVDPFHTNDPGAHQSTEHKGDVDNDMGTRSPAREQTVVHKEVGKVVYFYPRINGEVIKKTRFVSQEMLKKEMDVRSKSLFNSGQLVRKWRTAGTEIFRARYFGRTPREDLVSLGWTAEDEALLDKIKADCQGSFREAWEELSKREKGTHWLHLSLWMLRHSPDLLPDFLFITCQSTGKPVFVLVADCVIFLNTFYPETLTKNPLFMKTCLDPDTWPVLFLPQKVVRLYLKTVDRDEVYRVFKLAHKKRLHLKPETLLCFMTRFTEFGDIHNAIEMLRAVRKLDDPFFSLNSEAVIRHCCKLLMLDSVVNTSNGRNFRILPHLLEIGVRPNRDMMNVVLSNAFKTGDPQVGLDMLQYMKNEGYEPDSYTYVTLLKDAVARNDQERLESLLQEIQPLDEVRQNAWISSKILHSQFIFKTKHIDPEDDPNEVFYSMLDMYNQMHDITPLKELSIIPPQYNPPSTTSKSPPSVVALYIMVATYLRCQKQIPNIQRVYNQFLSLALRGHETIAPLAATDHTFNEFLVAYRNDPRGLRPAVRVVEDMLQISSETDSSKGLDKSGILYAKPTVRAWTLLMSAFVYNKQPHAAEKVRMMMAKHGVECNMVTWNVIISNFANAQNIPETAKAIKEMENQGFTMDEYTLKSLRYLRDPERLWVAIEELDQMSASSVHGTGVSNLEKANDTQVLLDEGLQRLKENMKPRP